MSDSVKDVKEAVLKVLQKLEHAGVPTSTQANPGGAGHATYF